MPPRLLLRPIGSLRARRPSSIIRSTRQVCLFCSLASGGARTNPTRKPSIARGRSLSSGPAPPPDQARHDLSAALQELQKQAGPYVDLARLRLALLGLRQPAGRETVRVAVLGLAGDGGGHPPSPAPKEVLRLLLADPLRPAQEWEQVLGAHDAGRQPLVVRVGREEELDAEDEAQPAIEYAASAGDVPREMSVSSPALDGQGLELLLAELGALPAPSGGDGLRAVEQAVLAPAVDVPLSSGGETGPHRRRYAPVATPVHRALVVGEGLQGAARVLSSLGPLIRVDGGGDISAAVDLPGYAPPHSETDGATTPQPSPIVVDLTKASTALSLFRQGPEHAHQFEVLWAESGMPALRQWLLDAVAAGPTDSSTRPAVRALVASLLAGARAALLQPTNSTTPILSPHSGPVSATNHLPVALAAWSAAAHAELQTALHSALATRQWRRGLAWWRLLVFPGRADDVVGVVAGVVGAGFLVQAEKDAVFLAGRIAQGWGDGVDSGVDELPKYDVPTPVPEVQSVEGVADKAEVEVDKMGLDAPAGSAGPSEVAETAGEAGMKMDDAQVLATPPAPAPSPPPPTTALYPLDISLTRSYLLTTSAPALQALAQRLVVECASTSFVGLGLGGLTYAWLSLSTPFSTAVLAATTPTTALSWAGAATSLVAVLALRRLQRRWDAARSYWEGEVREEGRKALWRVEKALREKVEDESKERSGAGGDPDAEKVRELLDKADEALERLK